MANGKPYDNKDTDVTAWWMPRYTPGIDCLLLDVSCLNKKFHLVAKVKGDTSRWPDRAGDLCLEYNCRKSLTEDQFRSKLIKLRKLMQDELDGFQRTGEISNWGRPQDVHLD